MRYGNINSDKNKAFYCKDYKEAVLGSSDPAMREIT